MLRSSSFDWNNTLVAGQLNARHAQYAATVHDPITERDFSMRTTSSFASTSTSALMYHSLGNGLYGFSLCSSTVFVHSVIQKKQSFRA